LLRSLDVKDWRNEKLKRAILQQVCYAKNMPTTILMH
jgi:hypothetical protein